MLEKKFFRWLRGELNGYYVQKIAYSINYWVDEMYNNLFCYIKNMQFQIGSEDDLKNISSKDFRNIALFAGVIQIITSFTLITDSLRMTESHVVYGKVGFRKLDDASTTIFDFATSEFSFANAFGIDTILWAIIDTINYTNGSNTEYIFIDGYDFSINNLSFNFNLNGTYSGGYYIALTKNCTTLQEIIDYINTEILAAVGSSTEIEAYIIPKVERSERGLWQKEEGNFTFVDIYNDTEGEDITRNATAEKQAGMVPEDQEVLGYIPEEIDMFDENGNFISENVLASPPTDGTGYSEYYGEKFLMLAEDAEMDYELDDQILYDAFLIIQKIKYQGASLAAFIELTEVLVLDFLILLHCESKGKYIIWEYRLKDAQVPEKMAKLTLWENTVNNYFPQILLTEEED